MLVADSSDAAAIGAALRAEHGLACRKYVKLLCGCCLLFWGLTYIPSKLSMTN